MTPSTIPMPEGVGDTIRNRYAMENPAIIVPAENGTSNDRNALSNTPINSALFNKAHRMGRSKLEGFSVMPDRPSDTSWANSWARASLKYSR